MPATAIHRITPCFFVPDPDASAAFYRDKLGFVVAERFGEAPGQSVFVILDFGPVSLFLRRVTAGYGVRPEMPPGAPPLFDAYIHVGDVDALHETIAATGTAVEPPTEQPYGVREIAVTDPDGYRVVFGQDHGGPPVNRLDDV